MKQFERPLENLLFASRWIQAPVYLGLVAASLFYALKFLVGTYHLLANFRSLDETGMLVAVLGLIDMSMVINLLVVVIIGGYSTFVSKLDIDGHVDKPDWLSKMNAGALKIKLIISLVSISGVHLLKTFIEVGTMSTKDVLLQLAIHFTFILSAFLLAWTDKLMEAGHAPHK